jgi:hypothetical protein
VADAAVAAGCVVVPAAMVVVVTVGDDPNISHMQARRHINGQE